MNEKLELERLELQKKSLKFEIESANKNFRCRCLEIAINTCQDKDSFLEWAKRLTEFVESK